MTGLMGRICKYAGLPLLGALLALPGAPAWAETVTLKLGHTLPAAHYIQEHLVNKFAAGIEQASGGEIKFEMYPAAQLGKDTAGLLGSGLLDMGIVITGLQADKYPLSSVAELPEISSSACDGSAKAWALAQPGGLLDELEFKPQGLRVLSAHLLAAYVLFTRNKEVRSVADVSGLKLWASGPAAQKAIAELGGVAIRIPSPELYDAATRGTIDGAIFPYSGLTQYKLEPILKHAANGVNFGSGVFFVNMTDKRWNELSEKHRAIIAEQVQAAQQSFCEWIDNSNGELRKQTAGVEGYVMVDLDDAAKKEFVERLEKVQNDWAADLDSKGRQGSAVLKAFREAAGR